MGQTTVVANYREEDRDAKDHGSSVKNDKQYEGLRRRRLETTDAAGRHVQPCFRPLSRADLVGQIYKRVDFEQLDAVAVELHKWAARDLGLGVCLECPSEP